MLSWVRSASSHRRREREARHRFAGRRPPFGPVERRKSPLRLERFPVCKGVWGRKPRKPQGASRKEGPAGRARCRGCAGAPAPAELGTGAARVRRPRPRRDFGLARPAGIELSRLASRFASKSLREGFVRGSKTLGVSLCLPGRRESSCQGWHRAGCGTRCRAARFPFASRTNASTPRKPAGRTPLSADRNAFRATLREQIAP